jgi:hypothetical protein
VEPSNDRMHLTSGMMPVGAPLAGDPGVGRKPEADKASDTFHRCLTDGKAEYANGEYPASKLLDVFPACSYTVV